MLLRVWNSLTVKEKTYYEAWSTWRTFKKTVPPWRFFGTKTIMRDHLLLIEQFEKMYILRKVKRQQVENKEPDRDQGGGYGTSGYRPNFGDRANKTISVL